MLPDYWISTLARHVVAFWLGGMSRSATVMIPSSDGVGSSRPENSAGIHTLADQLDQSGRTQAEHSRRYDIEPQRQRRGGPGPLWLHIEYQICDPKGFTVVLLLPSRARRMLVVLAPWLGSSAKRSFSIKFQICYSKAVRVAEEEPWEFHGGVEDTDRGG